MPRPRRLLLALTLTSLGCTPTVTATQTSAPTLATTTPPQPYAQPRSRSPSTAQRSSTSPSSPRADEQWRLARGDADGWVRIWANGKLLAASRAHPGGLAALQVAPDGVWYTAGFDGRVLEWPAHATQPSRAFTLGNPNGPSSPITAMAVAGPHLVLSDGHHIQMWTREPQPQLVWSIYDRNNAGLIGRRLEDQAHYPLALVKPWAFWTDASGNSTPASTAQPNLPTGDFALGPKEEVLILDHFPGYHPRSSSGA